MWKTVEGSVEDAEKLCQPEELSKANFLVLSQKSHPCVLQNAQWY
jgi:hypothetical protein